MASRWASRARIERAVAQLRSHERAQRRLPDRRGGGVRGDRFRPMALAPVRVRFRTLGAAEIEPYLRLEQPYDCAGSAKCETLGIALLEAIESRRSDGPGRPAADPHLRAAARAPASIRSAR